MATKKFEGKNVVSVKRYNQGTPDKNGKEPVILLVQAGRAPNRIVLSGTVAENAGFEVGKTYLAQCRELEPDEQYGRQFSWTSIKELDMMEILNAEKALGAPNVFDASEEAEVRTQHQIPANEEAE